MRGVCDQEGVAEKVKNGLLDTDIDKREVDGVCLGES